MRHCFFHTHDLTTGAYILQSQFYTIIGGGIFLLLGVAAAIGYTRSQAQKIWRESAEGWKAENDANKEKAERVASELIHTAAELKNANSRTDLSVVLGTLRSQHLESTTILTRIADESQERNGHIASVLSTSNEKIAAILARSEERSTSQHSEVVEHLDTLAKEETLRNTTLVVKTKKVKSA